MKKMITVILVLSICLACAATEDATTLCSPCAARLTTAGLLNLSRANAIKAQESLEIRDRASLAKEGLGYAQVCLNKEANNLGCLYYRAVNRGLVVETGSLFVTSELKKMMADFETVATKDPAYENGGSFVALGSVYLKSPSLPVIGGGVERDLTKAQSYVEQALAIAPRDSENLKFAGEVAYAQLNYSKALTYFNRAQAQCCTNAQSPVLEQRLKDEIKRWVEKAQRK